MNKTFNKIIGVSIGAIVVTGIILLVDKQIRKAINKSSVLDDEMDLFAADFDWDDEDDNEDEDEYNKDTKEFNDTVKSSQKDEKAKYIQIPT